MAPYLECYEAILSGQIEAGQWRSDLGSGQSRKREGVKNITQIMWPSELIPELLGSPAYHRALDISRQLLGDDMAFDFDMLIDKAPGTDTPTPFHQDMAYWVDLPDRRAVSCWIALDEAIVDNGCMWFAPGSHRLPLRQHRWHGKSGGALECDGSEAECVCVPLKPGSCTFHNGGVMHYSRRNTTAVHRRALIVNFRPEAMIRLERERGFDHGKTSNIREKRT
ncbi:MAG: phytanoyl-CoA dioxygenase family protein [Pirellulaceae bacterium]|nr:phytanoyl-CoA dioxygenase family protein [Pirellulaceae bacterium]